MISRAFFIVLLLSFAQCVYDDMIIISIIKTHFISYQMQVCVYLHLPSRMAIVRLR